MGPGWRQSHKAFLVLLLALQPAGCRQDCEPCIEPPRPAPEPPGGQGGDPAEESLLWNPRRLPPALDENVAASYFSKGFPTPSGSLGGLPMNMKLPMLEADDREKAISPRETVAALNLEPGSTVLDIGAGTGILTFEIARVLDGKGKVYATDVAKNMIDLLKTRVRDWGIANVEPVLVSGEGVDPFYRQHKFDVIIAFEMFVYLADPAAYFRELRGSLKSEKGRLFIGNGKHFPRFDRSDFADLPAVAGQLRELAPTHPLIKRLDPKLVAALTAGDQPDGASAGLAEMLAKAFNAVLDDNLFFGEMDAYYNARTQVASEVLQIVPARLGVLTRWLVYAFDQTALFEEPSRVLNDQEKYVVFTLNKILLEGLFRQSMATTNFAFPKALYLPPAGVARKLEKAGFRLVRVHDSLPYFDLMEFAPN